MDTHKGLHIEEVWGTHFVKSQNPLSLAAKIVPLD